MSVRLGSSHWPAYLTRPCMGRAVQAGSAFHRRRSDVHRALSVSLQAEPE